MNQELKENNRQWALIIMLMFVIFIGYIVTLHNRYDSKIKEHYKCDSVHKIDKLTIDIQKRYLDSAVYFK